MRLIFVALIAVALASCDGKKPSDTACGRYVDRVEVEAQTCDLDAMLNAASYLTQTIGFDACTVDELIRFRTSLKACGITED